MFLETKGIPDGKQYMFFMLLLGKEGLCHWESFPLITTDYNNKEQSDHVFEAFEGCFLANYKLKMLWRADLEQPSQPDRLVC